MASIPIRLVFLVVANWIFCRPTGEPHEVQSMLRSDRRLLRAHSGFRQSVFQDEQMLGLIADGGFEVSGDGPAQPPLAHGDLHYAPLQ